MTDREACYSGALYRACELIHAGSTDDYITEQLIMDGYNLSGRQYAMIIRLARAGHACAQRIDPRKTIGEQDWAGAPRLPE